jgi:hypothetical protein
MCQGGIDKIPIRVYVWRCSRLLFVVYVYWGRYTQQGSSDIVDHETRQTDMCENCGRTRTQVDIRRKVCGSCRDAYYCDRGCQKQDWPHHRKYCKSVGRCAYAASDLPEGWWEVDYVNAWLQPRSKRMHVSIQHMKLDIVVVVPEHPIVYDYMQWHSQQEKRASCPMSMISPGAYVQAYGFQTLKNTLRLLYQHGRPLPKWDVMVSSKNLSITVVKTSGETSEVLSCKYSDTVDDLKRKVQAWVFRGRTQMLMFELLDGTRRMRGSETLSEADVCNGARLTAVTYIDERDKWGRPPSGSSTE